LSKFDPVKKLSGKKLDGEQFYNKLLQSGANLFINFMCNYFVPPLLRLSNQKKEKVILDYVKSEKPDLIISVMPFVNLCISNAAHALNIPFLLTTTDGDLTQWVHGLRHIRCSNFIATIGFETSKTRKKLQTCGIDDKKILLTGFPIRQDFLEKKNKAIIRKQWNLPERKFTVMLSMGSVGSASTYSYARKIMRMNLPIHLIACVGKNQRMMYKLRKITPTRHVTLSLIPFTDRFSDLMAVSDLFITKPGPGVINEALHMQLPMILDATTKPVFWEKENIAFVRRNKWGDVVTNLNKLEESVSRYVFDQAYIKRVKKSLQTFKPPRFSDTIIKIIANLCPPK
jgi:processive 1,2-diacylglycerol beta-glucosyltransferase